MRGNGARRRGRLSLEVPECRVLALAHTPLRCRNLLGWRPSAQRPSWPHLSRDHPDRRRTPRRGRPRGKSRARRRRDDALFVAQQVGAPVGTSPFEPRRQPGPPRVPRLLRLVLPRGLRGGVASTRHARRSADQPCGGTFRGQHPNLVVPALYVADDATLDWLVAYARAGGHLVLGPRTGYGDHEARARSDVMPARIAEAAGVWYDEFSNLPEPIPVTAPADSLLACDDGAAGTRWADGLNATEATVLATYNH